MDYYTHPTCQIKDLDDIYTKIFGEKRKGLYIDVGAYDGVNYSNVYGLAQIGWKGILIEPVTKYFNQCRENYKDFDAVFLNMAIGSRNGSAMIYTGDHAVSTLSTDFVNKITKTLYGKNLYTGTETCSITTLDFVLMSYAEYVNPVIDVLSIDTEGYEMEVLKGFSINLWKPTLVIVEAHELNPHDDRPFLYPEINDYFKKAKYSKIYSDEINNIYIRE